LTAVHTKLVRRWNARTPWIVAGVGVGVAALGAVGLVIAKNEMSTYDDLLRSQCPNGCGPAMPAPYDRVPDDTAAHESRSKLYSGVGIALLSLGGAVSIAGLVGVYLNQPRPVAEQPPVVTPTVGPNGAGASVTWSF